MKKAVIATGGKQYIVSEGEYVKVELMADVDKQVSLQPLLLITDESVTVGKPLLEEVTVTAEVVDADKQADKVLSVRYKAKKRVHKVHGHRQHYATIKITKIA
jgi:large subunit ribosomal protein L21